MTAIVPASSLMFYPFTCQTTLNMSQKQNSTAEVQSAFPKSIYAQVLSITGMASKWINSAFEPGPPGNTASQKPRTPCAPNRRMRTHVEHHILYILFEIQSTKILLKIRKVGPNYPAKKSNFKWKK